MKFAARIFLVLFFVISSLFIVSRTNAQVQQYNNETIQQSPLVNPNLSTNTAPDVPKNLNTWTQTVMLEVLSALDCQITGLNPSTPDNKCLGIDPKNSTVGFVENGGAIGVMGGLVAQLYRPPIHTGDYVRYLSQNFGFAKKTYAQTPGGLGFTQLSPILPLWSKFRDIMYLFFVGVFVVVGMAIMLRIKIDPRTVMTVENQIPKVIIALILITFSFAIAGFLIDIMYVSIYLVFNIFGSGLVDHSRIVDAQQHFGGDNVFGVMDRTTGFPEIVSSAAGSIKDIIQRLFSVSAGLPYTTESGNVPVISGLVNVFKSAAMDPFRNFLGWTLGWVAAALATLVIGVAVLWSMFRLWFQLLLAYGYTLMDIVLGPFWIGAGLLPGGGKGFLGWLRDLMSNLAAFPTTLGMFLLARAFMNALSYCGQDTIEKATASNCQGGFIPPLIGNPQDLRIFGSLIGLSLILMTPQVVAIVKDAFKAPEFKHTGGIRQALGTAPGAVGGVVTAVGSPYGSLALFRKFQEEMGKSRLGKIGGGLVNMARTKVGVGKATESDQ